MAGAFSVNKSTKLNPIIPVSIKEVFLASNKISECLTKPKAVKIGKTAKKSKILRNHKDLFKMLRIKDLYLAKILGASSRMALLFKLTAVVSSKIRALMALSEIKINKRGNLHFLEIKSDII